ncbi:transposable element Tc1 transposase [Trichonephila clavipes]|nr:transposable element Tc1 transposase [Trichonephila clavipes]
MTGKRARRHFAELSEFERGLIIGMKTAGWSTRRVAGQVDRSECAVRNCWEQWTREGTPARKTGSGVTRKTTRREDRRIVRQALVDPTVTRSTIRADVGVAIALQTISRHLAEANLISKLPLTPEHRQLRLQWCQARSKWNATDWQKVVSSDESRFGLRTDDNRVGCGGALELCFRQDGATCHAARATIDLLKDTLGDRLISRFGPVNWPPRSCDLTPLDYFLWGYVKSLVYADKPQTLDHLEDNIHRVIADIRPQMLEKVIEDWTSRLDYIRVSRGSSMPEILFKIYPLDKWFNVYTDGSAEDAIKNAGAGAFSSAFSICYPVGKYCDNFDGDIGFSIDFQAVILALFKTFLRDTTLAKEYNLVLLLRQRPDRGLNFIMAKCYMMHVVSRSFEYHTCDSMIWLVSNANFEGGNLGMVRGLPPLFHQPHEMTCGSPVIYSTPMPRRHYIFTNIHVFSEFLTQALRRTVSVANFYTGWATNAIILKRYGPPDSSTTTT